MKILYYNWIQFDKKNNTGGGVNVYQKNLVDEFTKNDDNEVFFLSSGIYYDLFRRKIHFKETKNIYGDKCRTFKLINSAITAPASTMAKDIKNYLEDNKDYEALKQFIEKYGPFDVIHFNNIEGLSLKCLKLKKDFPNTKFIFSVHNYVPFCPQVNLFYDEEENCKDYCNGEKCVQCVEKFSSKRENLLYYKIDYILEKLHMEDQSKKLKKFLKNLKHKICKNKTQKVNNKKLQNSKYYVEYRKENVKALNENFDVILAVSDRVRKIAIDMGINENKVYTNYIGTKFANTAINHKVHKNDRDTINIAYLGYFEKKKGFDFLVESLEKLPKEYGKKINFYCYAKINSDDDQKRLETLENVKSNLLNVYHYNGYTHDELSKILSNIDLGIVPVIWEDNLPQIAIEFIANGVPIITSDMGGAQELFNNNDFVFEAGNTDEFILKLENIIDNKEKLDEFFSKTNKLTSMDEHINALLNYYKETIKEKK